MSTQQETVRQSGELLDAVRAEFVDVEQRTVPEISESVGSCPSAVRDALQRLQERGEVEQGWDIREPNRHLWTRTEGLNV